MSWEVGGEEETMAKREGEVIQRGSEGENRD